MSFLCRVFVLSLLLVGSRAISAPPAAEPAELFAAIAAGDVEATFIPRDSRQAILQFANRTDRPLVIQLPPAFAGMPVLAQFQPIPGNQQQQQQAPQQVGGPFNNNNIFMNIPAGRVIRVRANTVCLQHGLPEPNPHVSYKLAPLESSCSDPALAELFSLWQEQRIDDTIAQLAAWHIASGKNWRELADMEIVHASGYRQSRYSRRQIEAAARAVESLPSRQAQDASTASR